MVNNKSFKSTDLLRIENEELRSRLAKAEESVRSLQSEKANTNFATGKKNEQAGPKVTRNDNNISIASLYSSMTDGVAIHEIINDVKGKAIDYLITGVNPAFENITGLKKRKIIGKKATEVFSVTKAPYIDKYSKVASTGKPETFETFFPSMEKYFHISVFSTGKGKFATVFQDITERKRSEALTSRQNSILEAIKLILEATLTLGTERELGSACLEIAQKLTQSKFGFIAEIREKGLQDLSISNPGWEACNIVDEKGHKMSGSIFKKHGLYGRVISDGKSLIANDPLNHPDSIGLPAGHPSLESFLGVPLIKGGQTIGIIALGNRPGGYSQTEQNTLEAIAPAVVEAFIRKRTDDALRASEERLRIALDAARLGTWDFDLKSGKGNNSLRHDQIFGYNEPQQGWTFDTVCSHLLPEYDPIFRKAFGEAKKTGVFDFEGKIAWPDSTIHWIATHGVVHFNSEGRPDHVIGVIADITEHKRSEEDLKRSEQLYHAIGESIDYGIWVCDKDGKNTYASESYLKLVGLTQEQCSEFGWGDTLHPDDAEKTIAAWKECSETGGVWDIEHRLRGVDGKWHPILARGIPIRDENGNITMWAGINLDISKIKLTEKSLRESEERLRVTLSSIGDAVLSVDKTGRISFLNPAAAKLMGWEPVEALGRQVTDVFRIIDEKTLLPAEDIVQKVLLEGKVFELSNHTTLITKDGRQIPIEDSAAPIKDQKGNVLGVILVFHDVSQKRRSAEALHSSLVKYKTLFDCLPLGITVSDENGQILESNKLSQVLLGITKEEQEIRKINGQEWQLLASDGTPMSPDDYASVRALKENHIVENVEMGMVRPDNTIAWINVTAAPIELDGHGVLIIYSDITERKKAEQKLKESEDRFRTISESIQVMIAIVRIKDSILTFVNEPYEKKFGFKTGELKNKKVNNLFYYPDDKKSISAILRAKGHFENEELKVTRSDGSAFWIMTSVRKINFMNEPSYVSASIDITETKNVQEELFHLNRTLNARSKSSQAMMYSDNEANYLATVCKIIIEDCGHTMVWIGYAQNDKAKSVKPVAQYGFDQGYIDQLNITWDDTERGNGPTGRAIRIGKTSLCRNMLTDPAFKPWRDAAKERGFASSVVLPLISDGKPFGAISIYSKEPDPFSENEISLLFDLSNDLAYGISYLRLQESERAAVKVIRENETKLKDLIATKDKFFNIVAHDLKNPFTSLLGSSELLFENIEQLNKDNIKELAMILNDSAKGGYSILLNLLDWSRSQTGQLKVCPQKINLKDLIEENITNLQLPAANKEISLIYESPEDLHIIADKNMVSTILRNLLSNGLKFTPKKGSVVVKTKIEPDNVLIFVKDNGVGISPERIEKLFNLESRNSMPGTENEQGTGLGLKLSKEFAEKHGGNIFVESEKGKGSTFCLTLPVKIENNSLAN